MSRASALRGVSWWVARVAAVGVLAFPMAASAAGPLVRLGFENPTPGITRHTYTDSCGYTYEWEETDYRIGDKLKAFGVTFDKTTWIHLGTGHATEGEWGISPVDDGGNYTFTPLVPMRMTFDVPVNLVSVRTDQWPDYRTVSMEAFDDAGRSVAFRSVLDEGGTLVLLEAPSIRSVLLRSNDNPGGVAFDELTFRPVPEPGPAALGILSAGLLTTRRRPRPR